MATSGYYRFIGAVVKTVSNPLTLERFASLLGSARMRSTARNPIYMSHLKRVSPQPMRRPFWGYSGNTGGNTSETTLACSS